MRFVLKFAFARALQQNVFVFHVAALRWLFWAALQPLRAPRDLVKQHMACAYPLLLISRPFPGGHPICIGVSFMSKQAVLSYKFALCRISAAVRSGPRQAKIARWSHGFIPQLWRGFMANPSLRRPVKRLSLSLYASRLALVPQCSVTAGATAFPLSQSARLSVKAS